MSHRLESPLLTITPPPRRSTCFAVYSPICELSFRSTAAVSLAPHPRLGLDAEEGRAEPCAALDAFLNRRLKKTRLFQAKRQAQEGKYASCCLIFVADISLNHRHPVLLCVRDNDVMTLAPAHAAPINTTELSHQYYQEVACPTAMLKMTS